MHKYECCRFSRFIQTFEIVYREDVTLSKPSVSKGFRNIYNADSSSDIAFIGEKGGLTAVFYYRVAKSAWNRFVAP